MQGQLGNAISNFQLRALPFVRTLKYQEFEIPSS